MKEALNELFDRSNELSRAADRIDDAHDYFDTGNMTYREIVDAQLDLVEQGREDTAKEIRDLNWSDPEGRNEARLEELKKQMENLDNTQEYLGHLDEEFDKASAKFDEREQAKTDAIENWSEHCEEDPDPPVDDDEDGNGDDRPKEGKDPKKPEGPPPSP
jgi:uncharacterized protein YPO0396